jgi:hypothetical protein
MVRRPTIERLLNEVPGTHLVTQAGHVYVGIGAVEDAIGWLDRNGVPMLGIEGFRTDGMAITPLVEFIADSTSPSGATDSELASSTAFLLDVAREWFAALAPPMAPNSLS